ncbi:MAG: 4'-phosphopantetheinyl transferase superfamily protein [Gammaproteobacteria bacterium]|nr:4'-phosphopantetheinyl transferase superfamily protein [Gammaproteobacteria bacterium]
MNAQELTALTTAIRSMLPPGVAVAATTTRQPLRPLMESERQATASMAPQRLLEFSAGRTCAHRALQELGLPSNWIPIGPQREPLWPAGVVGSISHSRDLAVATVAPLALLPGIGIDIEPALPLDPDLVNRICRPAELARLRGDPNMALRAKFVFSAKESVYKCLWPSTRLFLDFIDVEIVMGDSDSNFRVIGWGPLQELSCASLVGRTMVVAGHIITVAHPEAAGQESRRFTPDLRSGPL